MNDEWKNMAKASAEFICELTKRNEELILKNLELSKQVAILKSILITNGIKIPEGL